MDSNIVLGENQFDEIVEYIFFEKSVCFPCRNESVVSSIVYYTKKAQTETLNVFTV